VAILVRDLNRPVRTTALTTPPSTTATATTSTPTEAPNKPQTNAPAANVVAGAVGGKALSGATVAVRVAGRDVDVLFPASGAKGDATFATYLDRLVQSGAFKDQHEQLATLKLASTTTGAPAVDKRPVIGVVLSEPKMLVPGAHKNTETILALVEKMGCRAVLIPPCGDLLVSGGPQARARAIAALASSLDGLVGPGGADVDPSIYGEKNTASVQTNLLRDTFEADFARTALDCDLFAFGICRSHQLWNAAAGGSLIQDVEDEKQVSTSHKGGVFHPLMVKKGSMLFEATRQEMMRVNSYHHQAVDFAGWGFRVVGSTRDEGTGKDMIEATERWNGITTQYHPELMQEDPVQRALFESVGRRAHAFQLVKSMKKEGTLSLPNLLDKMRNDPRYDASDVEWVKRELARRF
jgi:putative glutamine amidotransferase